MRSLLGTLTGQLLALMAALTIPVTAITVFALAQMAWNAQERYVGEAREVAFFVSKIVDNELQNLEALLHGAGNSANLRAGDFAAFHAEATRLVAGRDQILVLRDLDREQLLNTAVPFGQALPPAVPLSDADREAFLAGRVVVGGIYPSPLTHELRIPVALPVQVGDRRLVLAITTPAAEILGVIEPVAPQGWVLTIGDRTGTIVARTKDNGRYAGLPALAEYLDQAVGESGSFRILGFGGQPLLTGYARSSYSGWLTGANVPIATVEAPLWRNVAAILAVVVAAAAIAALIGFAFVRRFQRASAMLLQHARAAGPLDQPGAATGLKEFDNAIEALAAARTERSRAEVALDQRSQELQVVLDTVPAGVWFTYDPEVKQVRRNFYASRILRLDAASSASIGSGALTHFKVTKGDVECAADELPLQRAFRGEKVTDEEYVFIFADGSEVTHLTSAEALRSSDGKIVGAVSVSLDISERKRHETQQQLLINELNHRVKNTIATVQSIAYQTLRHATDLEEAGRALADRLVAVSRAYDVLTQENWEGTHLEQLLSHTLGGYGLANGRIRTAGEDCWVSSATSVTLSLVLHELAVNSIKHGALSSVDGRVRISWEAPVDARKVLTLTWKELGGPLVKLPDRKGFGLELLTRLSRASSISYSMDFDPSGVTCVLEMPVDPANR